MHSIRCTSSVAVLARFCMRFLHANPRPRTKAAGKEMKRELRDYRQDMAETLYGTHKGVDL